MADAFKEHPTDVLRKFREHVENFPEQEGRWEEWRDRFFELLWRWGESVNAHPTLRQAFLEATYLASRKEVQSLVFELRDVILGFCEALRVDAKGQTGPYEFEVRKEGEEGRPKHLERCSLTDIESIDYIESQLKKSVTRWSGRYLTEFAAPDAALSASLDWCEERAMRLLTDIGDALWGDQPSQNGRARTGYHFWLEFVRSQRKLAPVLLEGRRAELWRTSLRLLCAYHAYNPSPDSTFAHGGDSRGLWPYSPFGLRAAWGESAEVLAADPARSALAAMSEVTEWLCEQERKEGATADAVPPQYRYEGREDKPPLTAQYVNQRCKIPSSTLRRLMKEGKLRSAKFPLPTLRGVRSQNVYEWASLSRYWSKRQDREGS